MNIRYVHAVEKIADPSATVAVAMAGTFPYFSRRECFDLLGKCDAHIARLPAYSGLRAGHNKFDMEYSIGTYKPDIILHAVDPEDIVFTLDYQPVTVEVDGVEVPFLARKDSHRIKATNICEWQEVDDYLTIRRWKQ